MGWFLPKYGVLQKVAFFVVILAYILCQIGTFNVGWLTAKDDVTGNMTVEIGIWTYCIDDFLGSSQRICNPMYSSQCTPLEIIVTVCIMVYNWIVIVRILIMCSLVGTFVTGASVIVLHYMECLGTTKTYVHALMAFGAGFIGLCSLGPTDAQKERLLDIRIHDVQYSWGSGLFITGCVLLFVACVLFVVGKPVMTHAEARAPMAATTTNQKGVGYSATGQGAGDVAVNMQPPAYSAT